MRCEGGGMMKKKIIVISCAIFLGVVLMFGYHHFLTFYSYDVSGTIEGEEYSYEVDEIVVFPFQIKQQYTNLRKDTPWYFKQDWIPIEWATKISKVDHFFSFIYDKESSELVLKGIVNGDHADLVNKRKIKINNKDYKIKQLTLYNLSGNDKFKVTISIKSKNVLELNQNLVVHIDHSEQKWSNLESKKEEHHIISPFQSPRKYIRN